MASVDPQKFADLASSPSPLKTMPAPLKKRQLKRKLVQWIVGILALVAAAPFAARVIYHVFWYESTDDAFLKAHIHTISARVPGNVIAVPVHENQKVKKGDVLVKLDPSDYELAIREAQARFSRAHKDVGRFHSFMSELDPTDRKVFDEYEASALVTDAQLTRAQLQYKYTTIVAPEDGKVGRVIVETGEQIQPGQALMALVEPNPWIEANFKEHQVTQLAVGKEAEVAIDAIPEKKFKGHVESIAPGSGSTFSLLPPDNATGNFTKIVQRIPVRVFLDADSVHGMEDRLVPGMSAEVTIKVK